MNCPICGYELEEWPGGLGRDSWCVYRPDHQTWVFLNDLDKTIRVDRIPKTNEKMDLLH